LQTLVQLKKNKKFLEYFYSEGRSIRGVSVWGLFYKSICMIIYEPVCVYAGPKGRPVENAFHFVLTPEQQQQEKPPSVGGNLLKAPLCKQQQSHKKEKKTMLRKRSHRRAESP